MEPSKLDPTSKVVKFRTIVLERQQLNSTFNFIVPLFAEAAETEVEVTIGWGASAPTSSQWESKTIPIYLLDLDLGGLAKSLGGGIGRSDVFLDGSAGYIAVMFSHESWLTISTSLASISAKVSERWRDEGILDDSFA